MPVIRAEKNENCTDISMIPLEDMTLSLRAKGLFAVVLCLADGGKFSVQQLTSVCQEGMGDITSVLNELEQHGYLVRKQNLDTTSSVEYTINEIPQPCLEESAQAEPAQDGPDC